MSNNHYSLRHHSKNIPNHAADRAGLTQLPRTAAHSGITSSGPTFSNLLQLNCEKQGKNPENILESSSPNFQGYIK